MSASRISARYAKALIDLATEQGKLDKIYEDIEYFMEVAKHRDFALLLKSPIVKPDSKAKVFKALFAKKLDPMTNTFFGIIINKGRESYAVDIAKAFTEQYKAVKNISTVKLTTAAPVSDATVEAIKKKLAASNLVAKNIDLETSVDAKLLGGFVLEFDDKLYDASIAYQLDELKKEFSKNNYIKNL